MSYSQAYQLFESRIISLQSTINMFIIGMSTQKIGGEFTKPTNWVCNKNDASTQANLYVITKEKKNKHAQVKLSPQYEN